MSRQSDIDLVEELLACPALYEEQRRALNCAQFQLSENDASALDPYARKQFETWQRGIAKSKARRGKSDVKRSPPPCPAAPRPKAELPDWMRDPSLLPKRPPGQR